MSDLLMIVPSRGRPDSVAALAECWDATGATAGLVFAVDDDDPELDRYLEAYLEMCERFSWLELRDGPRRRLCGTLNQLAAEHAPSWRNVGFMGDDHRPSTPSWDARFVECLSGGGPGLVYGNDLLMGEAMPTLGYMAPPALVHLCIDLAWKDWGEGLGRITYLPDVIIEHMHPANGKAPMDAGYEDANSPERVSADSKAYYAYRDGGGLQHDLEKLRTLL